jgi:gamma-glutamylcyclotransferase (GGCT)/AIG2-like uncharacterized protein YtfP
MKVHLFSYGTLQQEDIQKELFGRVLRGSKDSLKGYRVSTIEIKEASILSKEEPKTYLIALPSNNKNDRIEGVALEITEQELPIADDYETGAYKRVRVVLESGKEAWVYGASKTSGYEIFNC